MTETERVQLELEHKKKDLLFAINRLLLDLQDELRHELPVGLELHQKTLQIVRLKNYRNAAFDEDGNWR
jgi:hypothetical protein